MMFRVFRGDDGSGRFEDHEIVPRSGMTVLDALIAIKEERDPTLVFRYACHWAVCGSCAMTIDGVPRLACKTQLSTIKDREGKTELAPIPARSGKVVPENVVLIEPLIGMPIIRDLIVDMSLFYEHYKMVGPVITPSSQVDEKERMLLPSQAGMLERYAGCILCGACVGACPVSGIDPMYLGPAALAQLYRFSIDPRDEQGEGRLKNL